MVLSCAIFIACEATIDDGQELITTADGLPTWQSVENGDGSQLPPVAANVPVFISTPVQEATQDERYVYSVQVQDADAGDQLIVHVLVIPSWLELTSISQNQFELSGTPTESDIGTHNVALKVIDLSGLETEQRFSIIVRAKVDVSPPPAPNQAPVSYAAQVQTSSGADIAISLEANDADGDSLAYTIVSQPKHGSLSTVSVNTVSANTVSANTVIYSPNINFVGTDNFSFQASDGSLSSNSATVTVDVTAPVQSAAGMYRVIVDTDIGHDPDDIQSLYRLLHYSDILRVEGLYASASMNTSANLPLLKQWIKTIRIDEVRAKGYPELMSQADILATVRSGPIRLGGPARGRATAASNHMIASVKQAINAGDNRPLYILVWGPLTTVAQALHDSPDIAPHIRIYSIGSSNFWADEASRNYIYNFMKNEYPALWWIENGSPLTNFRNTYFGIFSQGNQAGEWANTRFIDINIRNHGVAGNAFPVASVGLQEGDSPSMLYLLSPIVGNVGNVDVPSGESWGGQFTRHGGVNPNYYVDCCNSSAEAQRTISKWRVQFLNDWKLRWDRYK